LVPLERRERDEGGGFRHIRRDGFRGAGWRNWNGLKSMTEAPLGPVRLGGESGAMPASR